MKKCEIKGCGSPALKDQRFCKDHKKMVKDQMKAEGYFAPVPHLGTTRTSEMKENIYETKYGKWNQ